MVRPDASSPSIQAGPPTMRRVRSGSAEGWTWFHGAQHVDGVQQGPWCSGFLRDYAAKDPEDLEPLELFKWLATSVQLSEEDIEALEHCQDLNYLGMAKEVFHGFYDCPCLRKHLHIRGTEDIPKRRGMIEQYLAWCTHLHRGPLESYVTYLEHVASAHRQTGREVPVIQLLTGLAITHQAFMRHVYESGTDPTQSRRTISAVSKLFWIQAVFFLRGRRLQRKRTEHKMVDFSVIAFSRHLVVVSLAMFLSRWITTSGPRRFLPKAAGHALLALTAAATCSRLQACWPSAGSRPPTER